MPGTITDLGLYVHLPWCVRKCPYCDFNSHEQRSETLPFEQYTDALLQDLAHEHRHLLAAGDRRELSSVFFGGGTPSLFPGEQIARVLDAARDAFGFAAAIEITLEANPGTIEHGDFAAFRAAGVNRVSLGAQSFDPPTLTALGRIHGAHEIEAARNQIAAAGIDNLNIDLMYGLPQQTPALARNDIERAIALAPQHISYYQLTLEPNTLFHKRPPPLPDENTAATIQDAGQQALADAGFAQYEISAYARAGAVARHNLLYWEFGDYLGIGAGAHGKWTCQVPFGIERTVKERHPRRYMERAAQHEPLGRRYRPDAHDLAFEYPLNTLRLKDRLFDVQEFARRTGVESTRLTAALTIALRKSLMRQVGPEQYATTSLGWRFLNDLQALFLQDEIPK